MSIYVNDDWKYVHGVRSTKNGTGPVELDARPTHLAREVLAGSLAEEEARDVPGWFSNIETRDNNAGRRLSDVSLDKEETIQLIKNLAGGLPEADRIRLAAEIAGIEDDRLK